MWLADIFRSPRQNAFFALLRQQVATLVEAAGALDRYIESGDAKLADEIQDLEHRGDAIIRDLIRELRDTFVTPIDRDDLFTLGEGIDDMIDYLNNAAREYRLFGVSTTPEMQVMAHILIRAAEEIQRAVLALTGEGGNALEHARVCSDAENQVERVYREALARLFDTGDVRTTFKLREIYRHLSNCADRADAVAKEIAKIAVS